MYVKEDLLSAIQNCDRQTVQTILSQRRQLANSRYEKGMTALMWACKKNQSEIVRLLISYGASKETRDDKRMTAFLHAAENGADENIIDSLLQNQKEKYGRTAVNDNAEGALVLAAAGGYLKLVKYLMKSEDDTGHKETNIRKAIDCAVKKGDLSMFCYLVGQLLPVEYDRHETLSLAVISRQYSIVQTILKDGNFSSWFLARCVENYRDYTTDQIKETLQKEQDKALRNERWNDVKGAWLVREKALANEPLVVIDFDCFRLVCSFLKGSHVIDNSCTYSDYYDSDYSSSDYYLSD